MNCQDIASILDDGAVGELPQSRRLEAQQHMAQCAECTRDWSLHQRLIELRLPAAPAGLIANCRAQAAVSARAPWRLSGRHVIAGTAVAVAAAMLLMDWKVPGRPAAPPPAQTAGPGGDSAPPLPLQIVEEAGTVSVIADLPAAPPTTQFTVYVLPSPYASGDGVARAVPQVIEQRLALERNPAYRRVLEALHAGLLLHLRSVPGLMLVEGRPEPVPATAPLATTPRFIVAVGGLFEISPAGGPVRVDGTHADFMASAARLGPDNNPLRPSLFNLRLEFGTQCLKSQPTEDCSDPATLAGKAVAQWRNTVFPADSSVLRGLQARIEDSAQEPKDRMAALGELYVLQNERMDSSVLREPAVVRGVVDLAAAAEPALRAQVWRAIRGAAHPELVEPLISSAQRDGDDARLQAVATLGADFAKDPRVVAVLSKVAAQDERGLIRALAQRALSGEESWKAHIVASLKNERLPAWERMEGLVYEMFPPGLTARDFSISRSGIPDLLDETSAIELASILPAAHAFPGGGRQKAMLATRVSARAGAHPAMTAMLLELLRRDPDPMTRSGVVQSLVITRRGEPGVAEALHEAMTSDPDPRVREWVSTVVASAGDSR